MTGAGSGGHITPILAVAHELKEIDPKITVVYIGQKGDSLADIPRQHPDIDEVYTVPAGKLRRYHGMGLKQLLDVPTLLKNARDAFRVINGLIQAYFLLGRIKPDVIFVKGGFIGVPVGLSAAARHIPYITHDSDAVPGLANRIIARWATLHTTALPKEYYSYPPDKTETVGVPIVSDYQRVTDKNKTDFKQALGLKKYEQLMLVTGGGLGAVRLNDYISKIVPELITEHKNLVIIHITGRGKADTIEKRYQQAVPKGEQDRVILKDFVTDLYRYSGAADLIVARAGATNLMEFAVQGKPCIVVPNPLLVAGHQLKNANALNDKNAIALVDEETLKSNPKKLLQTINRLLAHPDERKKLGDNLHKMAQPDAARRIATILLSMHKNN